jgi:hypothetical protein
MASHSESTPTRIPFRTLGKASGLFLGGVGLALVLGVVAVFLLGRSDAERMWRAVHFNWIFWSGMSMGLVMLNCAHQVTNARWAGMIRRFTIAGAAFLPVSFVLFLVDMFGGREVLFHHWLHGTAGDPVLEAKSGWLNWNFLITRDILALVVLYGLALYYTYLTLRPDVYGAGQTESQKRWYGRLTNGFRGVAEEAERSQKLRTRLAPILGLCFAFLWSMLGVDIAMSMLPHWFSTMFPVTFFIGPFHSAIAMNALMVIVMRKQLKLESFIGRQHFHDMGKMLFAFAVFWMYINWSQYVVIWYGLLPHEQEFFVQRFQPPFGPITALAVTFTFVAPFLGLLLRSAKKASGVLAAFAVIVLVGHWLDRFLITVPSIYEGEALPLGLPEIGVALGFGALWLTCYTWFLRTFPVLPSPASLAAVPQPVIEIPANSAPGF